MNVIKSGDPNCKHLMKIHYGETETEDKWVCEHCGRIEANPVLYTDFIVNGKPKTRTNKPATNMNQIMFQLYGMK